MKLPRRCKTAPLAAAVMLVLAAPLAAQPTLDQPEKVQPAAAAADKAAGQAEAASGQKASAEQGAAAEQKAAAGQGAAAGQKAPAGQDAPADQKAPPLRARRLRSRTALPRQSLRPGPRQN